MLYYKIITSHGALCQSDDKKEQRDTDNHRVM